MSSPSLPTDAQLFRAQQMWHRPVACTRASSDPEGNPCCPDWRPTHSFQTRFPKTSVMNLVTPSGTCSGLTEAAKYGTFTTGRVRMNAEPHHAKIVQHMRRNHPIEGEAEAISRAQAGDSKAFETLYALHKRRVYSLCLRMLGNVAEAEDLTQEAFLQHAQAQGIHTPLVQGVQCLKGL